ncbi:carboxypeptidase-like regulatory domain-containing protein [Hymenobacter actinosclerus]|uniref:CarboxypepD_reg-like domain-containing protein n=1 Tax=Hymenobacter actinosclerus TaxID=82805 RepID=A0A1I0DDC6_9BACT|nr:carboxypeptidase-like regulatory domain-containing protein [Hymenobacter actinosclerus]SET29546.1 CarboxypepD_reg-like domain-containing protein [Hymenobacter actinosclerus]
MDPSTPTTPETTPENEDYSPGMFPDEQELSSGNGRLALIAGGIVAAVLAGYLMLPASITQASSAPELPTPTMELGEASITGTRIADETAPATAATATAAATPADAAKPTPAAAARTAAAARAAANPATAAADNDADEPILAPVVPATPVAVAEPIETAPATLNMTGRVLDENGRPLAGATILLKGSRAATSTDANGNYSLEVPAGTENTLLYGYGGYEDQLLRSRNAKTQVVTLLPKEGTKRRKR